MDTILITDLEVYYCVGVPDHERSKPQRLLLCIEMQHDFQKAAKTDDISATIDYYGVSQRLLHLGLGRNWKLIETLACDIAAILLKEFGPAHVRVEVKKFIIPEARFISVRVERSRS